MHPVAVLRFAYLYLAQAVKAFGKHRSEYSGHVLDDDDAEVGGRQTCENASSACVPPVEVPMAMSWSVVRLSAGL